MRAAVLLLLAARLGASVPQISTVLGGSVIDGPAASAQYWGWGLVRDSHGNYYVADTNHQRVRKIDISSGLASTVAGNGGSGFYGDGGPATLANLRDPVGVYVDAADNVFIADSNNGRIRKVDGVTGIISTIAGTGSGPLGDGGPASSANLFYPQSVAGDSAGNLYITDTNLSAVRRIDGASGIITRVAGTYSQGYSGDSGPATLAQLKQPYQTVLDAAGNLYIADTLNSCVRKVDAGSGNITTLAGTGVAGFSGDGGPGPLAKLNYPQALAVDVSGNVYVSDEVNQRVRRIDAGTGFITTVAGNGVAGYAGDGGPALSAEFNYPGGIAVDNLGGFVVCDFVNRRIRAIDSAGTITTLSGDGFANNGGVPGPPLGLALDTPLGVAVSPLGDLYVAEEYNHRVLRLDHLTGLASIYAGTGVAGSSGDGGPAASAQFSYPKGICLDAAGNLYITDYGHYRIRKVDAASGIISTVAGNGVTASTGDGGPALAASLEGPQAVYVDGVSQLYIATSAGYRIRRVDLSSGIISTFAGNGSNTSSGDGGLATAAGIGIVLGGLGMDAVGNFYFSDFGGNRIRRVDSFGFITTVAGVGGLGGFAGDGGPAIAAKIWAPVGLFVAPSGDLYIGDTQNYRIRKVDAGSGLISTLSGLGKTGYFGDGGPASAACLTSPYALAGDSLGNLYIADSSVFNVRRIDQLWAPYPTQTPSPTLSCTQTQSPSPTSTRTPSATTTLTPSPSATQSPVLSPSSTVTKTPTITATPSTTPSFSPSPSFTPSAAMTATPTPSPTLTLFVPAASELPYVFPHPSTGAWIQFAYRMKEAGRSTVLIFNERGDIAGKIRELKGPGMQISRIEAQPFAVGVYFYRVILDYDSGQSEHFDTAKFVRLR
jgi:sugar lactone lactonase YvrE